MLFCAADADCLYVMGGRYHGVSQSLDRVDIFDVRTATWRTGPALNNPRNEAAAAFLDDDLYVVGGFDEAKTAYKTERLQAGSHFWEEPVTTGSDNRCFHALIKIPTNIG